jgi:hypothetical protein
MSQSFDPAQADHSDMYVGCFTGYDWDQIKFIVNSLDRTGFAGRKVMIVMGTKRATVEKLAERGWKVVHFGTTDAKGDLVAEPVNIPVHVLRFYYLTDVRDVVFQSDPFVALRRFAATHPNFGFIASSESMRYRDEPWGNRNLMETFTPPVYEKYKDREMYNVGVLGGTRQAIQELAQTIFEMAHGRRIQIVDQSVFNFLINQDVFNSRILKLPSEAGWAAQLGTTADPAKMAAHKPFLMEPSPILKQVGSEYKVFTSDGSKEYPIVHQYERIPEWRTLLEAQYDDK